MKIIAVRIGDRYDKNYESYLESKLPDYDFVWIREEIADNIKLQWNKIYAMSLNDKDPICVIDIDILLINHYKEIFEFHVQPGEFLAMPGWWRNDYKTGNYKINGGFYKFYPRDCNYIYDKFMENPTYYQRYYIENGYTSGPVNGEQYFIADSVKERLKLKILPEKWFARMDARPAAQQGNFTLSKINKKYREITGNPYMFLRQFHPDIKFVHFTHMDNHPHKWEFFNLFV